jgi:hypothetical protein
MLALALQLPCSQPPQKGPNMKGFDKPVYYQLGM